MSSGDASKSLRDDFSSAAGWGYGSNVPAPSATSGSGVGSGSSRQEKDALLLDVFPQEASTDLAGLEQQIRALNMPGVKWGEQFQTEEVGYGIKKLRCQAILSDMKQETMAIQDAIQRCKGVKSCDFVAFTKC